jgi:hypothetical protein
MAQYDYAMRTGSVNPARDICEILKLDPRKVRRLSLHIAPDSMVTVDAEMFVLVPEVEAIKEVLKACVAVEAPPAPVD